MTSELLFVQLSIFLKVLHLSEDTAMMPEPLNIIQPLAEGVVLMLETTFATVQ